MNLRFLLRVVSYACFSLFSCNVLLFAQSGGEILGGSIIASSTYVLAWESFSYPLDIFENSPNTAGDSIHGGTGGVNQSDVNGQGGWTSSWILEAESYETELDDTQIDTSRITHQDALTTLGSFSLRISTPAINGPYRQFPTVTDGELWISFVYQDTGPVEDHDSGLFVLDSDGEKLFLLGKPRNSEYVGISHLPVGTTDQITTVSYAEPHELMVRIVLNPGTELNGDIYLWVDPDENDDLGSYDAGGKSIATIGDLNAVMLSRRQDAGSGYFDDICITSQSSLPPTGSVHIDLGFDPSSSLRKNSDIVLHDTISTDSFWDTVTGSGYGHNKEQNFFMVVRGFIYLNDEGASRVARGIPIDRLSGLSGFTIAPFHDSYEDTDLTSGGKNALRFAPETGTSKAISLTIPEGNYGQCRILTSGDEYGTLAAVFAYVDGSTQETSFRSPDWLDDSTDDGQGGLIPDDILQINNGMNRLTEFGYFEGSEPLSGENPELDDASFFVGRATLDKAKTLVGIRLGPSSGSVINVYDMILDADAEETPVKDWMMF